MALPMSKELSKTFQSLAHYESRKRKERALEAMVGDVEDATVTVQAPAQETITFGPYDINVTINPVELDEDYMENMQAHMVNRVRSMLEPNYKPTHICWHEWKDRPGLTALVPDYDGIFGQDRKCIHCGKTKPAKALKAA